MTEHPNRSRVQAAWDGLGVGDPSAFGALISDDLYMFHAPGAGPFAGPSHGTDRLIELALFFEQAFEGTFHQAGACIHADDDCAIALVRETGTMPDGAEFDNRAIWIMRFRPGGIVDGIWTVDLDDERMRAFWADREAPISAT